MATYLPVPEHCKIFELAFGLIKNDNIRFLADVGSGRTSLFMLLRSFKTARVDAIIAPEYKRLMENIKEHIIDDRYRIINMNICTQYTKKQYDLAVCHLTISRGYDQGNDIEKLKRGVFSFCTKYLLIVEDLNHDAIKSFNIINYGIASGFRVLKTFKITGKPTDGYRKFNGQNDIGYLFEKI